MSRCQTLTPKVSTSGSNDNWICYLLTVLSLLLKITYLHYLIITTGWMLAADLRRLVCFLIHFRLN